MVLELSNHHLQAICTHAESTYPEECCGLLLGLNQNSKILVEVIATENVWSANTSEPFQDIDGFADVVTTKRTHYTIAPETMLKVQREARDRQLDIIGIYHSHPDHPAIGSEFDRKYAWQGYSYIIVCVQQGKAGDFNSWILDNDHQFQSEEIMLI